MAARKSFRSNIFNPRPGFIIFYLGLAVILLAGCRAKPTTTPDATQAETTVVETQAGPDNPLVTSVPEDLPPTATAEEAYPPPEYYDPYPEPGGGATQPAGPDPYPGSVPTQPVAIDPYPGAAPTLPLATATVAQSVNNPSGPVVASATPTINTPANAAPSATSPAQAPTVTSADSYPGPATQPVSTDPYPGPGGAATTAPATAADSAYPGPGGSTPTVTKTATGQAGGGSTPAGSPTATLRQIMTPTVPGTTPQFTPTPQPSPTSAVTPTPTPIPPTLDLTARLRASSPRQVKLASGQVQLIEFFAFWDGNSKAMVAITRELEDQYKSRLTFTYLDIDDPDTTALKKSLRYHAQPEFILLDPNGKILQRWSGYVKKKELEKSILAALVVFEVTSTPTP